MEVASALTCMGVILESGSRSGMKEVLSSVCVSIRFLLNMSASPFDLNFDRRRPWAHANGKLKDEKVYWVTTSSPRGPHTAPVWGIWKGNTFYFETDPASVKGKNLKVNPRIVVHVQDGFDTVIIEGKASRERNPELLKALRADYFSR